MNRKQRRRANAIEQKVVSKSRQKWENRVIEEFVGMGWTENQVRSHMRYIKTLAPSVVDVIRKVTPVAYAKAIVQQLVEQMELTK